MNNFILLRLFECSNVTDFNSRSRSRYLNCKTSPTMLSVSQTSEVVFLSKFHRRHFELVLKFNAGF